MDCVFCKIVQGEIPCPRVLEDENAIVIADLHPQSKKHYLVIPKKHVDSLAASFELEADGKKAIADLFSLGMKAVHQEGLLPGGFRSVINTHEWGGQSVFHLHLHLLGGEQLRGSFGA